MTAEGKYRHTDPWTSAAAARWARRKAPGQCIMLLQAHGRHPEGLTDEEAAQHAHISLDSEYATRCSELMRRGLIVTTIATRRGAAGPERVVRRITPAGLHMLGRYESGAIDALPPLVSGKSLASRRMAKLEEWVEEADRRGWDAIPLDRLRALLRAR